MRYFNVCADFKKDTIDKYAILNDQYEDARVYETYGQVTVGNIFEGGRDATNLPKVDLALLEEYIAYSKMRQIDFNYSLNGSCMGNKEFTAEGAESLYTYLYDLYRAGVRKLTVALPSVMELVLKSGLEFEIKASIICDIQNANDARNFKLLGANQLVVSECISRDFKILKEIVDVFTGPVEVLVNSLCYKDCIYRTFHYNQTAHDSFRQCGNGVKTYYNHRCLLKRLEDAANVLRLGWIRPEDMQYYEAIGIHFFKIQGRHTVVQGDPVRAVESFFKRSYDGNLIDLLELFNSPYTFKNSLDNKKLDGFLKPFAEHPGFCKNNCDKCGYCSCFAEKHLDIAQYEEIKDAAEQFYVDFDEYNQLIANIRQKQTDAEQCQKMNNTQEIDKFEFE